MAAAIGSRAEHPRPLFTTDAPRCTGIKEVGQAVGLSAKTAEAVDITLQAVQTATGQPLQPLDVLSSHMQTAVSGGDPLTVALPPPADTTAEQARTTLMEMDPPAQRLAESTTVLTTEMLGASGGGGSSVMVADGATGGKMVTIPSRTHILIEDDVKNSTPLKVLNVGPRADVVVAAKGHPPQSTTVALAPNAVVKFKVTPPPPPGAMPTAAERARSATTRAPGS